METDADAKNRKIRRKSREIAKKLFKIHNKISECETINDGGRKTTSDSNSDS
uniref:Uncharacterized protein n=1 Tax=Cucumis melo TaxID=3656 RepID=A0A9I9DEL5_CUCME